MTQQNVASSQGYARMRSDAADLVDVVATNAVGESVEEEAGPTRIKRQRLYEDHRAMSAITEGIKSGMLHQVRQPMALRRQGGQWESLRQGGLRVRKGGFESVSCSKDRV